VAILLALQTGERDGSPKVVFMELVMRGYSRSQNGVASLAYAADPCGVAAAITVRQYSKR